MEENKSWEYDVKCRMCGKITRMHHSTQEQVSAESFKAWASEHSTFPVQLQCSCQNGMITFCDIVSFGNALCLELSKTTPTSATENLF